MSMQVEPQKEHQWLQKLVGEWTYETAASMAPGKPPEKATGSESVRKLGELWVLCEGRGEMPGGFKATTLMTLGYDPQKKRFVGSWVGSMMTWLWIYDESLDATGKVLTLESEGPDMSGVEGKLGKYRDVIEWKSDDHRVLTAKVLGDNGEWNTFMTSQYRRRK